MSIPRPHSLGDLCASVIVFVALSLVFSASLSKSSFAQDATGALEGHVADKTGAVINRATVSLKNLETNASALRQRTATVSTVSFNWVWDDTSSQWTCPGSHRISNLRSRSG
jgi:hypothetical protein